MHTAAGRKLAKAAAAAKAADAASERRFRLQLQQSDGAESVYVPCSSPPSSPRGAKSDDGEFAVTITCASIHEPITVWVIVTSSTSI